MENANDKIKVYQAVNNMRLKIAVTIVILLAFITVLVFLCTATSSTDKIIFAAFDTLLAGTMYPLTKHFFPALKETIKEENNPS
jgi:hypothetical protein